MLTSCCFQIQKGGGRWSSPSVWDESLPLQIARMLPNTHLTQLEYSACLWTLEPMGLDAWNEAGSWLPHLSDKLSRLWPDLFILRQMGPHPQLLAQCSLYSRRLKNAGWGLGLHGSSGNTCEKWREGKQVWQGDPQTPVRVWRSWPAQCRALEQTLHVKTSCARHQWPGPETPCWP